MEIREKQILELFLGLVFVALLIIIALIVICFPGQNKITPNSYVISNSYNLNSFNREISSENSDTVKIYVKEKDVDYREKNLRYLSSGEHFHDKDYFGNYKDEFKVTVVNKDYQGGYFKVQFYFCNYDNNCFSRTISKYIPAKEKKDFAYIDIQNERYKYSEWHYKVFPDEID